MTRSHLPTSGSSETDHAEDQVHHPVSHLDADELRATEAHMAEYINKHPPVPPIDIVELAAELDRTRLAMPPETHSRKDEIVRDEEALLAPDAPAQPRVPETQITAPSHEHRVTSKAPRQPD